MGNPVTWFQLDGPEPEQTSKFYSELFGWHVQWMPESNYVLIDTHDGKGINGGFGWKIEGGPAPEGGGFVHANVDTGGPGAQGGISSSPTGQPHVMMYARVDDLQKYLSRAESLGGTTATRPMKVDDHTSIGVFQDPQGIAFGLYTYTP